jgi:predicted dehydrogenase
MIGAGGIARGAHANGWLDTPDAKVVAVCDIDEDRAAQLAEKVGAKHVVTDFNELLALKDVDAVDICTPNRVHTPAVLAALQADKHVVCEKPLAVSTGEVLEMGQMAEARGLKLMTAQHMRWSPMGVACKQYLQNEGLGNVYHARVQALRRNLLPCAPGFIRKDLSGGGPCMDIGVHALDLAMHLMDFPTPVRVTGVSRSVLADGDTIPGAWGEWDRETFDVEDFAAGFVHFDTGATMSLEACWLAHRQDGEQMQATIQGDRAAIDWPAGTVYGAKNRILFDAQLKAPPGLPKPHTAELQAFLDCVVNDRPSPVPYTQTVKVIAILEGIYQSQQLGREIAIELDPSTVELQTAVTH